MTKKIDSDIKVLKAAAKALMLSSNRRMLRANLEFLWDYFIRNPSKELPDNLKKEWEP